MPTARTQRLKKNRAENLAIGRQRGDVACHGASLAGREPITQPASTEACKVAAFDHHGVRMNSSSESADTLRIYGNLSLLEMAPVLLAAKDIYAGETLIEH